MELKDNTVYDCSVIDVSKIYNEAGNITVVENGENIPFDVKRIYYLYDIPGGEVRGGHAHYDLEQVIFALSGSLRIKTDDGYRKSEYWLRNPQKGIHLKQKIWREMDSFSQGAVCMVIASHKYDEDDYIRNYKDFTAYIKKPKI